MMMMTTMQCIVLGFSSVAHAVLAALHDSQQGSEESTEEVS